MATDWRKFSSSGSLSSLVHDEYKNKKERESRMINRSSTLRMVRVFLAGAKASILGDPGADSGDEGKSKRAGKCGTKKSRERQEEPLGTMSYQTSSKRSPPFWLLISICPWVSEDEKPRTYTGIGKPDSLQAWRKWFNVEMKVVFHSRLLIRTRRDFLLVLELNKLQRIGIFGGKNDISGETRPGSRQITSTSRGLAGSHSGYPSNKA